MTDPEYIVIDTLQGKLRGRKLAAVSGRPYYSFQGIPYAKPPVGPLRFKLPQPILTWDGTKDAVEEGNVAPQLNFETGEFRGDEDCLYVNVYTPKIQRSDDCALIPTVVWIHGGGFLLGSGNSDIYGPERLMDHDIVLVTINYRLGVLGFLSTGDHVLPGNLGLKDQVIALKWVKANISSFGGDPCNVTISGESAGAMSCHLLILSPAADGLFHRAILQSGAISPEIVAFTGLRERSFRLARYLGFSGETSEELHSFMMTMSAKRIVENMIEAFSAEEKLRIELFPFIPTVEPTGTIGSFLTDSPKEIMKSGKFNKVPIIIGINSREGAMFLSAVTKNDAALWEMNDNFYRVLPSDLPVEGEARNKAAQEVKRLYFGDRDLDETTVEFYCDLRGDLMFAHPSLTTASCLSSVDGAAPVYYYLFDVVTKLNCFKKIMKAEHLEGSSHVDEVAYIFTCKALTSEVVEEGTVEATTVQRMIGMWANFAKTGIPIPDATNPLYGVEWTPFSSDSRCYLHITNDGLSIKKDLFKERMELWDRLYRQ